MILFFEVFHQASLTVIGLGLLGLVWNEDNLGLERCLIFLLGAGFILFECNTEIFIHIIDVILGDRLEAAVAQGCLNVSFLIVLSRIEVEFSMVNRDLILDRCDCG